MSIIDFTFTQRARACSNLRAENQAKKVNRETKPKKKQQFSRNLTASTCTVWAHFRGQEKETEIIAFVLLLLLTHCARQDQDEFFSSAVACIPTK